MPTRPVELLPAGSRWWQCAAAGRRGAGAPPAGRGARI